MLRFEDDIQLLQSPAPGLNKKDVYPERLHHVPHSVNDVDSPANAFETDGSSIRVDKLRDIEAEIVQAHAFGTDVGMQALDRISHDQWIDAGTVEYAHKEDERYGQVGHRLGLAGVVVGGQASQADQAATHGQTSKHEQLASSDSVTDERAGGGAPERRHVVGKVIGQEAGLAFDPYAAKNIGLVVRGQIAASPLS